MQGHDALLVTGTHGKTTTSALLAHVLMEAHLDPTFALGGISLNTLTNGQVGTGRFFVAEADESDGTFLNYPGYAGIITNIEEDHLDFWKTKEALVEGFKKFAAQISTHLWWCKDECGIDLPEKATDFPKTQTFRSPPGRRKGGVFSSTCSRTEKIFTDRAFSSRKTQRLKWSRRLRARRCS